MTVRRMMIMMIDSNDVYENDEDKYSINIRNALMASIT